MRDEMRPPTVVKKVTGTQQQQQQQLVKKGPWTAAEDAILNKYVRKYGEGNWNSLPKNTDLQRCGKSCRLRWVNHLRPNLRKDSFTPQEEMLILVLHFKYGNRWARIAKQLPGRTDNEIKNYWNTRINRNKRKGLALDPMEIQKKQGRTTPSLFISAAPPLLQNEYGSINRGKNISFQFPNSSPVRSWLENFDLGPPSYTVKTELPSSQFYSNSGGDQMPRGNIGLFDVDRIAKLGCLDCFSGTQVMEEMLETDAPTLIDVQMTAFSDWFNSATDEEIEPDWFNSATDEEIELDMQQPVESDYGLGSCSCDNIQWNYMPGIC